MGLRHIRDYFNKLVLVHLVREQAVVGMQNFRQESPVFDFKENFCFRFFVLCLDCRDCLFEVSIKFVVFAGGYFLFVAAFFRVTDIICVIVFFVRAFENLNVSFRGFGF